ncbi:MAG: peptidoglycan editing factor PgeF [Saprospiraceae bacterium]|nr:peptidoglycan editing factor PgeF [Saprospiraceae bacterium]
MIQPKIFTQFPNLAAAQSTRHGGVSPAPYHSLNLGKSTADDPANVAENRRRFCAALGFEPAQIAWSKQVHGDQIRLITEPGGAEGFDALVTNVPGILLAVSVADCTPILVYDARQQAMAAIHAGWRGTVAEIVAKTLIFMQKAFGTSGEDCFAYIGACIDECSFEVGDEVAVAFTEPFKRFDAQAGKFFVDLKKANAAQLLAFGIPEAQIEISPYCTMRHSTDFFSHRKDKGLTGRGLGVIGLL